MTQAQWTRATYMIQARNFADATSAGRWSDTEVVWALGQTHTAEWKRILNANRMVRAATRTVAQDASGQIALSALDSGSGDSQQRLYRILDVAQGTRTYDEAQFSEVPTAALIAGAGRSNYTWYRFGDVMQFLPLESGASMTVWVNHLPTPIDQLSADTIAAEFPRDYETIIALDAAARLLLKGAAEADAAALLQQQAEAMRQDMLADLARTSTNPIRMSYPDTRDIWGG